MPSPASRTFATYKIFLQGLEYQLTIYLLVERCLFQSGNMCGGSDLEELNLLVKG